MRTQKRVPVSAVLAAAMLASLTCLPAPPLSAAPALKPLAAVDAAADLVTFQPQVPYSQVRVTVTGPEGFEVVKTFDAGETPAIDLQAADGLYKYELRFSPVLDREARELLAAAREAGTDLGSGGKAADKRMVQRGTFSLAGGSVVPEMLEVEPKVVLTNGDGVVRNSLCVGFDCPNAPVFGDSTILMMENNTRIKFGDTSNSPFPNNDWEIEANSSSSGGASYLGFNDCGSADNDGGCATDLVFAVESGARQSALYVESDGDVGIGTSNPVLDLHIVTGNTPSIRLDQDGSSGFTPQVWDIAGNEANFFVRDVTAGSRLPLRIRPGAPTSSIDINGTGSVGIGTASPDGDLDIDDGTSDATLVLTQSNAGNAQQWEIKNNAATGRLTFGPIGGSVPLKFAPTAVENLLRIGVLANNTVDINGNLTLTGVCAGCDEVFQPGYPLEPIEEHAASMWENSYLPAVGPTPEGEVAIDVFQKTTGILQELEKAHIYIEQLHTSVKRLEAKLDQLERSDK